MGERRALGSCAWPRHPRHQAVAIEHGMHSAGGWYFDRVRQSPHQALPNLTRTPVRFLALGCDDRRFHLFRQLVGIAERPTGPITKPFQTAFFVPLEDLVSGLTRDPKLPA